MTPITRAAAIAAGLKWYFTGKPCKHGHVAQRQVSSKGCSECHKAAYAKWEAANLERRAEEKRARRAASPERFREVQRRSRERNPAADRERSQARYCAKRHEYIAANMARKAALAQRTPPWADHDAINEAYEVAAFLRDRTGIKFVVDHEVPLRGKLVSGLHVQGNLRIITEHDNRAKGNKWPL